MLAPISRLVRIAPQTLRPKAQKSASHRALPSAYSIACSRPSALRGSTHAPQRSGGRMSRKSIVRAPINPPRLTRRSSGTLRQQAGLRPSTLRYTLRTRKPISFIVSSTFTFSSPHATSIEPLPAPLPFVAHSPSTKRTRPFINRIASAFAIEL